MRFRSPVLLVAFFAVLSSFAVGDAPRARFSDALSYTGSPKLALTLAVVVAGGGASAFNSATLIGVLAGDKAAAEVDKLNKQFGNESVKQFLEVFNFVIN